MAQQQQAADVHPDELCPPNKRYDLMDANKKVDLEHVQCPSESKILMNIIKNHLLRFSIAASASVPWIYMAQFWHTLKEDGSKHRLKFLLDRKELTLTLDDFRTIFHLPQANDNNHASFVPPPSFSDMVPFYKQVLGFTMELKTVSNFKISGLLQPWQTLCKIFSKCLTTRVTGWDYTQLMWEGIYYSLHHPVTSIPYPRFTKIIISHYMTIFPDISRRARDAYHNLQDDDIMKNIFNSGRNKNTVGMRIPAWMITKEMKLMEHYKMYAEVFRLDVPMNQSQPTKFTQGTHKTLSAPRSPNPATETTESSVPKQSTMIRFQLPSRQSARLTPPVPSREEQEARENVALVYEHLAAEEIEKLVEDSENVDDSSPPRHDDTSIPGTRLEPRSDKESTEVEIVQEKEEETSKDTEVEPNIVIPVNVDDEEDEITDEVFELRRRAKGKNIEESRISPIPSPTRSPRNLSTLVSSDTEKLQELTVTHPTPLSGSSVPKLTKTNHLLSLIKAKPNRFKRYKSFFLELQGQYGYLFAHLKKRFMPRSSNDRLADNLHDVMMEMLPSLVKEKVTEQVKKEVPAQVRDQVPVYLAEGLILESKTTKEETKRLISKAILQERGLQSSSVPEQQHQLYLAMKADTLLQQQDIAIWLALQMKFEKTQVPHTACRPSAVHTRDQDNPRDDAHPEGENNAKRQKTSKYEAYVSGESSSGQVNVEEPEIVECLALPDLGSSINLMPLSIWKKLSLPELTPTQMILELADRSTTRPTGIAKDVFVRVGKFHFPADFVVVDYVIDPRVPLILRRPFLRMARALIDVYGEELTLRVSDEAITFKVGNTSRYSYNDTESINRIDVIDVACEEYSQEVLGFSDDSESGNPTPTSKPIVAKSSPSLTPFEGGDFNLEEIEDYLASNSVHPGIDEVNIIDFFSTFPIPVEDSNLFLGKPETFPSELETFRFDMKEKNSGSTTTHADVSLPEYERFYSEGDIQLLEKFLNNDPSSPLFPKEIKVVELKNEKSSIDEPPELELKDLPSHLEYAFLEGTDKLPVIIAKNLKDKEKERLIKCMMAIFHDMIEETMEVFMDDFLVFGDFFSSCLSHLDKMLKQYEDTNLVLNWEKCHFLVKESIILGYKILKSGIEVDRAKVDVIAKLSPPTSVKGIQSFLGHIRYYH
ncbi:reverse transcriptase domain-containing protein [Tanacetum coccineum]